ncbi:Transmembrane protein [Lachnellula suecica]|uniref:Transmembrane protein n=1 Tax=Lachnellula suecica TaxID=602035 RepID=A0A8T9C374_9HELO|nr:Transmembrane protein [Lachnellula suecica]
MLTINGTCNSTLDDMRINSSEVLIAGPLTFHSLGLIIAAGTALIAVLLSFYLIWMHALHYTKPYEQRHIIRILFMIPVYATASFLSFWFYWHAIYFTVMYECYEAFAIASFFALMCHYLAPNLHDQKEYFRGIEPKPWVWPLSWAQKCCGGEKGCWRTPRSGLTWFNIIWTGVYQYCFIRVTMTITAVITQVFGKYCESSNSPVFAHIWILVIEGVAVTIAMFCLIQFYVQLRKDIAQHSPLLKISAIKLVVFLSFWQSFMLSILTSSTVGLLHPTSSIAYPDLIVGIPSLLICIEMAIFAVLHQWAFPWQAYARSATTTKYPSSSSEPFDAIGSNQGGFLGWKAIKDAMNPWDLIKGFARGMKWLFVGVRKRENDPSYKTASFDFNNPNNENDMALEAAGNDGYKGKGTEHLPIANEFRRSKFGMPGATPTKLRAEEGAGLIAHAQPHPLNPGGYVPARQRYDNQGQVMHTDGQYTAYAETSPDRLTGINPSPGTMRRQEQADIGMAVAMEPEPYQSHVAQNPYPQSSPADEYLERLRAERRQQQHQQKPSEQWANSSRPMRPGDETPPEVHSALWGQNSNRHNDNQF